MSRKVSYNYSIDSAARAAARALRQAEYERRKAERERRHAEWAERTSKTTSGHLDRYQSILDDIRAQGLDKYVSTEFDELLGLVVQARSLASTDPAAARDLSLQIGPRIGPLPRTARRIRRDQHSVEAPRRTRAIPPHAAREATLPEASAPSDAPISSLPVRPTENPAEAAWNEALSKWTDVLARDLAFNDLATLRQQLASPDDGMDAVDVIAQMAILQQKWETEAENERRKESELASLHEQFNDEPADDDLEPLESIDLIDDVSDDPEDARREAVRAVIGALEDAGFFVANPRLVSGDVVVVGTRPSGASATFNLTLDGLLEYDFSGYQGSSCDVDIDAVVPALQEIYGIQLTDETVTWRNPDDEDATARPRPGRTRNA